MGLAGCANFDGYPKRATEPVDDLKTLAPAINADAVTACLAAPTATCRNQLVGARMYAMDIRFSQFEETMFRETRTGGFGATLATMGLTGAAALSSGGTSQVLAGISAFIIGGREAFEKEILAERTVVAIHTAMRSRRAEVALRLRTGLQQPLRQYPVATALGDLNDYYNAGTVLGALTGITETVGASAQKAEAALNEQLSFRLDPAAKKLELAVCGDDPDCKTPNEATYPRIRACWPAAGVPASTLIPDFMTEPIFATQRAKVATCMSL